MNLDTACRCDFTPNFLFFDEPLCQDKWLILSGRIFGTSKSNSTTILKHLQLWMEKESKLIVEGITLETSKYSSVFLQGEQPVCQDNPPSPLSSDPESSTPIVFIIPVALALVAVSIVVVVVCIIVLKVYKKTHGRKLR